MVGHKLCNIGVAVDYWKIEPNIQYYFLTHAHADHCIGLSSTWSIPLYCSAISSRILSFRYKVFIF